MCLFVSLQGHLNICECDFGLLEFTHEWSLGECMCVYVRVSVRATLTDAGAEVSVFPVTPMVVGVTVVAAHRLQLDLLDLHGLCNGCVGSSCRRRCQTWGEEVEET